MLPLSASPVLNPRQKRIQERKFIKLSIATGSVFTIWAIVAGILGDSKSIIFDALFSMVGISLSGVSLLVNNFVRKPDDDNLPLAARSLSHLPWRYSLLSLFFCACTRWLHLWSIFWMEAKQLSWVLPCPIWYFQLPAVFYFDYSLKIKQYSLTQNTFVSNRLNGNSMRC